MGGFFGFCDTLKKTKGRKGEWESINGNLCIFLGGFDLVRKIQSI